MTQINRGAWRIAYAARVLPMLDMMLAACGAVPLQGGVVLGLFLAGLAGGPLHCGPMCGVFVLAQVADRLAATPAHHLCEWRRATQGALLPYHLGRVVTYAMLGALAGLAGRGIALMPAAGAALLAAAAGVFALLAWQRGGGRRPAWAGSSGRFMVPLSTLPALPAALRRGLPLGLLLGFLPCGFLYGGLAAAAGAADPWTGAAGMAAFAAGTVPTLAAIGIAGHAAGRRWQAATAAAAPWVLGLNAALLALLALRTAWS